MDLKPSTRDVDFTGPGESIGAFRAAVKGLAPGFKVDTWTDGQVFAMSLPDDYLRRSKLFRRMRRIELRHAHPVDLILTKVGRYDERDQEDIWSMIQKWKVRAADVRKRASMAAFAGNEQVLAHNLDHLLRSMRERRFGKRAGAKGGRRNEE